MTDTALPQRQQTDAGPRRGGPESVAVLAILLAPACLMFALFVLYPIVGSIHLSLYDWDGIGAQSWVGLDNYHELMGDPVFRIALVNNLRWLALYALAPALGLGLALFLNQNVFGIRFARSLFFMPFVISQVVVGLVFAWFFNSQFGLFNEMRQWFGLEPALLLEDERWAIHLVILAGLWPQTAYCMILYLTGLMAVDQQQVDAARLDGAAGLRLLWHVVLPQLRPISFIVAMVCVVGALRSFDLVMVMTLGGPYNSSNVLAYYMYEQIFLGLRYGYAAAIAVVLFVLMNALVAFFLWRLLRREWR